MSLTSCLKKAGPHIHPDDKSQILMAARENRAAGMTAAAAAAKAVADSIGRVETMLAETLEVSAQDAPVAAVEPAVTKSAERQTDSPEFKAWFGDSRVVDAEGKPLVVYHGTASDFNEFEARKSGRNYGFRTGSSGFFFTSNPKTASVYAEHPARANLDPNAVEPDFGDGTASIMPVYLSMQNPLIIKTAKSPDKFFDSKFDNIHARAKASGADGVIVRGGPEFKRDLYIVYEPQQIKSAIGNDGSFDAGSSDITKSAERAPIWYSQLQRAIEQVPERLATMAAPQWQQWLKANAAKMGVKAEELEWSGIDDYLKLRGKDKVASAELAQWVGANGVQVHETTMSDSASVLTASERQEVAELNNLYRRSEEGEDGVFDAADFARLQELEGREENSSVPYTKYGQYTLPGGPLSRDTEILSRDGWLRMDEVQVGDIVMTRRDANGELEWQEVEAVPTVFADKLYHFKNQSINMRVTACHNMLVKRRRRSSRGLFRAKAAELWGMSECVAPLTGSWTGEATADLYGYRAEDAAELIGWYISEGSAVSKGGKKSTLSIAQSRAANPEKCERIEALLGRMDIAWNYVASGPAYYLSIKSMERGLVEMLHAQGNSRNKFVPGFILSQPPQVLRGLMDGMLLGDGCLTNVDSPNREPRWAYHTNCKRLADDMQTLALLCGLRAVISQRPTGLYEVRLNSKQWASIDDAKHAIVDYNDTAYCVTVKNHAIYVRTGGVAAFTGNSNYREVLLTLPEKSVPDGQWRVRYADGTLSGRFWARDHANEAAAENPGSAVITSLKSVKGYKSSHWEQVNVLAHIRLNDRTDADGQRVLFVEELQSDWSAEGRKKGFGDKSAKVGEIVRDGPRAGGDGFWYAIKWDDGTRLGGLSKAQADEALEKRAMDGRSGVPIAPFVTKTEAWLALGLKRVIKMAVDEGYDRVALVSGEQSAERYDLSKHIDQLSTGSVPGEPGAWQVIARKDGEQLFDRVAKDDGELADLVGKDMAAKIIERKGGVFKGLDLKVGGEGMRAFYDQIVPNVARDVLKKLGGDGLIEVALDASYDRSEYDDYYEEHGRWPDAGATLSQPGFDITDKMRERAAGGVPMFSRERGADEAIASTEREESATEGWQSPSASKFDSMVYTMQDKLVDTKRVVAAIKDTAGEIRDDLDVYLQEELFHGRAAKRTEDFVHLELEPLVEQMRDDDVNIAELDHFLHARHAREANALIARRNPEIQDGGSGMLNQDASAYMAELPADRRGALEAAAAKVDAILKGTKKMLVDYQLESAEKVHSWGEMFEHYVPLMREDEGDQTGGSGTGQGFSIKGKEVKSRTGSTRKVVDILANISMQRERTIVRGEKNRVGQALVGLAQANPNPGFWKVDVVPTTPTFNPSTGLVENRADPMFKQRDNALVTKITNASGEVIEHAVLFSENDGRAMRMAAALKNLDAAQLEGFLGASAKITRYFASVNTQYNPVFGVVNLVRDVQDAMINLGSTELAGKRLEVARGTPSALRGIYGDLRAERRGEQGTSEWAQLWEDFKDVGGQTGYRQLFATSNDRAEAIKKALDPSSWMDSKLGRIFTAGGALKVPLAAAQRGAKWIFDWLSDYNEAMENSVRLSAYKAGLDIGMSKERAASLAKNLTVNFNRKGQAAQQAGALYAFFNASAQGTARMARTLFTMETGKPKTIRLSALGKKVVYGGMLLGTMQALGLAAAGFGDDDPPEFVRNNNLIIPTGGKKYISIPMPMGFRILPAIGRISTEWVLGGFKNTTKRSLAVVALFADSFNPIGSAGLSMQTLAPTAFDPLIALTENKDFTGRPIAKTSSNRAVPGHELGRDTATTVSKWLSEAINTLTGGTRHTAGVVSPTPDQIDYLIDQVTGGVGRELSKLEQTGLGTVRGEDVPLYKIPLVGRFVGNAASQASESTNFYANAAHLNEVETEIKGLRKEGKFSEAEQVRMKDPGGYLITVANRAELAVQKLRKEKSELLKAGASRENVIALEAKITDRMASLNRAVEALKARGQ